MPTIWPHATIRELLALAECKGEARAVLASAREARLFRFAIYSFRAKANVGQDLSVTVDNNAVVVTKRPEPPLVSIVQQQEA